MTKIYKAVMIAAGVTLIGDAIMLALLIRSPLFAGMLPSPLALGLLSVAAIHMAHVSCKQTDTESAALKQEYQEELC